MDAAAQLPSDRRMNAWRALLRTNTHLMRRLEQDLQNANLISIASYDVLVQLVEAPGHRLRMSELAEAVLLSRSGLSRLVDRMQRDGLVERVPDPSDARGLYTVLTVAGRDALRAASAVHLPGVSRLVLDRLSDAELEQLHDLMIKLDPEQVATDAPRVGRVG